MTTTCYDIAFNGPITPSFQVVPASEKIKKGTYAVMRTIIL